MAIDTQTLIWLFPIAFIFHDFEEILFWELWLGKHGSEIKARMPAFLAGRVGAILEKSTAQASFSIFLIFCLTVLASFFAAVTGKYGFFLLASGAYFIHGFMHLGQAIVLRKYVPAVITSALVVIPYGVVLFARLIEEGIVTFPGLLIDILLGAILMIPFILAMHAVGDFLFRKAVQFLIK
jgi:hypothetical protein